MKKILLATGNQGLDNLIIEHLVPKTDSKIVGIVDSKKEVFGKCEYLSPDILFIAKNLQGGAQPLVELMQNIKRELPKIRIIYLAGEVTTDTKRTQLATLAMSGIYDIIATNKINKKLLYNAIINPNTRDSEFIVKLIETSKEADVYEDDIVTVDESDLAQEEAVAENNKYAISSVKPGSGKTFTSSNVATCIAKYGKKKADGTMPRVCLIEADLQNLSLGNVLAVNDPKHNLKTALDAIARIINVEGELSGDARLIEETDTIIKRSFQKYSKCKNLEVLEGSKLTLEDVENVSPYHYIYLIEAIEKEYDVVIIDTNSSLHHTTTQVVMDMVKKCYYVLNLDVNNAANNSRYVETLKKQGFGDKIKYVLNQDTEDEYMKLTNQFVMKSIVTAEHIEDVYGFDFFAKIPQVPPVMFNNCVVLGEPIILDDEELALKARIEIAKVANNIWEIPMLDELEKRYEYFKNSKKKKGFFR